MNPTTFRTIAFINDDAEIRKILDHIGGDPKPPKITPPRGTPLWDGCDSDVNEHMADPDAWANVDQRPQDSGTQIDQSMSVSGNLKLP
jgi:hypothetical protein